MMSARSIPSKRLSLLFAWAVLAATFAGGPLAAQVEHLDQIKYTPLGTIDIPQPERIELGNGMVVYLLEDHELPVVDIQLLIRMGKRYEPPDKAGLAGLTATVMRTGGAGERSGDELDHFLEERAAEMSVRVDHCVGYVHLSLLTEYLSDAFPVLADMLRSPRFEEGKIEEAKVQERSDVARRNDYPEDIASREFNKLVYGAASPYARHTEYATIEAITREDLFAFHRRYIHPSHVMIGVTGDFERDEMLALIEQEFGDWKSSKVVLPEEFFIESANASKVYYVEKTDITQTFFKLGHLGTTIGDPDYFAVEVMNTVFGQGWASRLFNVIRSEKGLAYWITGSVGAGYVYPGVFEVVGSTRFQTTGQALEAAIAEIERMKEGDVTEEELAYAKGQYLNTFIFNFDTLEEVVGRQMLYEYYGYPSDFLQTSRDRIEAVTKDDVRRAAQRMIHPDSLLILCVGDASRFDKPLSEFGEVVTIDVGIPSGK